MGEGSFDTNSDSAEPTRRWADRNTFRVHPDPTDKMSKPSMLPGAQGLAQPEDAEMQRVVEVLLRMPDVRQRFAWTLRDSLDETLDGGRTGRWAYQHLQKTEKTALGTAIEVNLQNEFGFADGLDIDWNVAGVEIDCKFSKDFGKWSIPMEMYRCDDHGDQSGTADHLALLVWMNDDESQWAVGLARITDRRLRFVRDDPTRRAYNRDNKRILSKEGLQSVYWLWGGRQDDLPENVILHLEPDARARVFGKDARSGPTRSGQQRVNQLFREVQGRIVNRRTVQTVAQQDDPMKRARDARLAKNLGQEGILVLGHQQPDPHIAALLGLPVPMKGEFVATKVVPAEREALPHSFNMGGRWWRLASPDDERTTEAPLVKRTRGRPPAGGWLSALLGETPWEG